MSGPRAFRPSTLAALAVILAALAAIAATYDDLSQTYDEVATLAGGVEYLERGTYRIDSSHPPAARIASGLGPYLDGVRLRPGRDLFEVGANTLYAAEDHARVLALARAGVLAFWVLGCLALFWWTRMLAGGLAGWLAVACACTLPPLLAHAGLATTDLPLAAALLAATACLDWWLAAPGRGRALLWGLAAGLALATKFSALVWLPLCAGVVLAMRLAAGRGPRRPWSQLGLGLAVAALAVWALYGFRVGPVLEPHFARADTALDFLAGREGPWRQALYELARSPVFPAPEFWQGLGRQLLHAQKGHLSYLLGEAGTQGWWHFFPVALAVKTPLPFLALVLAGAAGALALRRRGPLVPAACAAAVFASALPSTVNLGVRYILPVYLFLCPLAGWAGARLWRLERWTPAGKTLVAALLLWQAAAAWSVHPDYLAWFNPLAGDKPEEVLVESDLDWGQDLWRLSRELEERGIRKVHLAYFGTADPRAHGITDYQPLPPHQRVTGWVAASVRLLKADQTYQPPYDGYAWLEEREPVAAVGRSIRLYHIPPAASRPGCREPEAEP